MVDKCVTCEVRSQSGTVVTCVQHTGLQKKNSPLAGTDSMLALSLLSVPALRTPPPLMRGTGVAPHPVPATETYLSDVALMMPPPALSSLVGLLVSRGDKVVTAGEDASLHPLLVPLTVRADDGEVTGLLRWPGAGGGGSKMPVVRTCASGRQLELIAEAERASADSCISAKLACNH